MEDASSRSDSASSARRGNSSSRGGNGSSSTGNGKSSLASSLSAHGGNAYAHNGKIVKLKNKRDFENRLESTLQRLLNRTSEIPPLDASYLLESDKRRRKKTFGGAGSNSLFVSNF